MSTCCDYPGCDYDFGEPSPMPALIIGKWFRRAVATGVAHQIVRAHYLGVSTVAEAKCGFKGYVSNDDIIQRKPRTRLCKRCTR